MSRRMSDLSNIRVAIIGGGLAGLAAAVGLRRCGVGVELFEARGRLGGRAASFRDPKTGQWVDFCQHVSMGCCRNLADFCRRAGLSDCFRRHRRLYFFGPDGRRYDFAPPGWLPPPLHLVPALWALKYLTLRERWQIGRLMIRLARQPVTARCDEQTAAGWLRRHGQSDRVIRRFWSVVLLSVLSDTPERVSLSATRKIFVDAFLAAARAGELEVPQVPLGKIFDQPLRTWLAEHGVAVNLGTRVEQVDGDAGGAQAIFLAGSAPARCDFDFVIVAVLWHKVRSLFSEPVLAALPGLAEVDKIPSAPITTVHLWFDRPITELPHAVLVDRLSLWVFNHGGGYYEVVVSGSHPAADREEVVSRVCGELGRIWPAARDAKLLHRRVVNRPKAVFSLRPGVERVRPSQQTRIANLMLAGDWTATGWPATMEGAVRSGYLAAEAVLRALGNSERLLVDDLPRGRLARLLFGRC